MRSFTTRRFREMYAALPEEIRIRARKAYALFQRNPGHPGLGFKQVDEASRTYSIRIGLGYRALGRIDGSDIVWFWIGTHAEYDKLI